jgi:hypothetical protein
MIKYLFLILIGTLAWWFFRRLFRELGKEPRHQPYVEGLSSICYAVSEIITRAAEDLTNADFKTVFVRFEEGVSRLDETFAKSGDHGASWLDLKKQVEQDLDGIRDRLFEYHAVFTKQQAALERNEVEEARKLTADLNGELDFLRQAAMMWLSRLDETSKRLNN